MLTPHKKNCWTPPKKKLVWSKKTKQKLKKLNPPIMFFSLHGNGDTIRIGREIQCLPYAGFFFIKKTITKLWSYSVEGLLSTRPTTSSSRGGYKKIRIKSLISTIGYCFTVEAELDLCFQHC